MISLIFGLVAITYIAMYTQYSERTTTESIKVHDDTLVSLMLTLLTLNAIIFSGLVIVRSVNNNTGSKPTNGGTSAILTLVLIVGSLMMLYFMIGVNTTIAANDPVQYFQSINSVVVGGILILGIQVLLVLASMLNGDNLAGGGIDRQAINEIRLKAITSHLNHADTRASTP